jgi:hypothetical protein
MTEAWAEADGLGRGSHMFTFADERLVGSYAGTNCSLD